ncbi:MAG: hypothetical protein D6806_15210 [Deltaproteobacteria bacterium]|nr:MAG: hypothetical protein D6806_15210 [Deltaproteobacteria bacterium]
MRISSLKNMLAIAGVCIACIAAGWLAAPSAASYLELQQGSDQLHRDVLLAEALAALGFLVFGITAVIFSHYKAARRVFAVLCISCVAAGLGLGAYVVRHDVVLEEKGTAGQLLTKGTPPPSWKQPGPWRRFAEKDGPGMSGQPGSDGTHIELDRIGIVLRDANGKTIWNRRRPGGWPAAVLESDSVALVAAPSDRFEDDVVIQAIDRASGRHIYSLHVLGRRVAGVAATGRYVAVLVRRAAFATLYTFPADDPQQRKNHRVDRSATVVGFGNDGRIELRVGERKLFIDAYPTAGG